MLIERWGVADWAPEESEVPAGQEDGTTHLWDESWDDDDTSEDFSKQLRWVGGVVSEGMGWGVLICVRREELAKVKGQK